MLLLMAESLVARKTKEAEAWAGAGGKQETVVSDVDMMGMVEKMNRGRR